VHGGGRLKPLGAEEVCPARRWRRSASFSPVGSVTTPTTLEGKWIDVLRPSPKGAGTGLKKIPSFGQSEQDPSRRHR